MPRVVLAYDGGPETTAAIPWLRAQGIPEVVAVTLDLGQGRALEAIRDRALAAGAVRAHVLDAREVFVRDYVVAALRGGAAHHASAPQAALLARPLIAEKLAEVAVLERATAVAHGCVGAGETPLELALRTLPCGPEVLAPARRWATALPEQGSDARGQGGARPSGASVPWEESNVWGRSVVGGPTPEAAPESCFRLTRPAAECPHEAACVEVSFEAGVPTGVNGVAMSLLDLLASLDTLAGAHGVGRVGAAGATEDFTQPWVGEMPAAVVLTAAHEALQDRALPEATGRVARLVGLEYARLVTTGGWFLPLRRALDGFAGVAQEAVSGSVRVTLLQGTCRIIDAHVRVEPGVRIRPRTAGAPGLAEQPRGQSLGLPS